MAAGLLGAAVLVRFGLAPWLGAFPFLIFFPALVAAALVCGWRQGLALLVASAAVGYSSLGPPSTVIAAVHAHPSAEVAAYMLIGGGIVTFAAALIDLLRRLESARIVQETLFRELQHRVANNMQVVVATLQTARRSVQDPDSRAVIDLASARIQAIAHLHRRLYDPAAYASGLGPVMRDILAETLVGLPVDTRVAIQADRLSADKMTAIVLLVNEAALNAAKHVFRQQRGSVFEVSLKPSAQGRLRLCVRDDGPGILPGTPVAGPAGRQLGMSIMQALARQLGSDLVIGPGPGMALVVDFAA